jgi:hypothetical protein
MGVLQWSDRPPHRRHRSSTSGLNALVAEASGQTGIPSGPTTTPGGPSATPMTSTLSPAPRAVTTTSASTSAPHAALMTPPPPPPRWCPSCLRPPNWCLMCYQSAWFPSLPWFICTRCAPEGLLASSKPSSMSLLLSLSYSEVSSGHPSRSSLVGGYG